MYQILMWGMALFLSAAIFITTFTGISETTDKRLMKQAVNLAGREIVRHIYEKGESLHIREKDFAKAVSEQLNNDGFIGCIFVYNTYASAVDAFGTEAVPVFFEDENTEETGDKINLLLHSILPADGQRIGIRFQHNSKSDDTAVFFSDLNEKPVIFLVLRGKKYYTISGYSLKLAGS